MQGSRCSSSVPQVATSGVLSPEMRTSRGALRYSRRCQHVNDVCTLQVSVADQVSHFPQVPRRQLVASLQPRQTNCVFDLRAATCSTLFELDSARTGDDYDTHTASNKTSSIACRDIMKHWHHIEAAKYYEDWRPY